MSNGNRPDSRPDPRPDSRDVVVRERKRKGGFAVSEFDFPLDKIPAGLSYEWKRVSTVGQVDTAHQLMLAEQGYLPVEAKAHPWMMPNDYTGPITRGDMMLMERPIELRQEAEAEDIRKAKTQMQIQERLLSETKDGTFEREARVSRTVEPHRAVPA